MNPSDPLFFLYENTIEIHYFFNDNSHSMDANIRHKSEGELLLMIKEVAVLLNIDINIESEAFQEGGLIEKFKILIKKNKKNITGGIITSIFVPIVVSVLTSEFTTNKKLEDSQIKENTSTANLNNIKIQEVESNIELKKLEQKESQLRIKKMQRELLEDSLKKNAQISVKDDNLNEEILKAEATISVIEGNTKIVSHKSNYYKQLKSYPKINKLSTKIIFKNPDQISKPFFIERQHFDRYIIEDEKLEPLYDENAKIEIISPVLKKGPYHWRGLYNGVPIDFLMEDAEFKEDVINQKEAFKNGTFITCVLKINRKIDDLGLERNIGFSVTTVLLKDDGIASIETPQGRKYKAKKEADKKQLKLFNNISNER